MGFVFQAFRSIGDYVQDGFNRCCCRKKLLADTEKAIQVWGKSAATITAPDGRMVPVLKPEEGRNLYKCTVLVLTEKDGNTSTSPWVRVESVPAVPNFDYSKFGMKKMDDVWFDPNNRFIAEHLQK
jgi:hypothetical protein